MAEAEAERERAEAELHEQRAEMHERGMADHELVDESEREKFAGTSAMRDDTGAEGDERPMPPSPSTSGREDEAAERRPLRAHDERLAPTSRATTAPRVTSAARGPCAAAPLRPRGAAARRRGSPGRTRSPGRLR